MVSLAGRNLNQVEHRFMKKRVTSLLFLLFALTCTGFPEELSIGHFKFDNTLGPTQVERLGPEAWGCAWPGSKPPQESEVELIVANFSPKAVEAMTEGGASLYDVALSTYMGLGGQAESINKALFLGATTARRVYQGKTPRVHQAHVFSKTLEDGSFVMVGIRFFREPNSEKGALLSSISNTFKLK